MYAIGSDPPEVVVRSTDSTPPNVSVDSSQGIACSTGKHNNSSSMLWCSGVTSAFTWIARSVGLRNASVSLTFAPGSGYERIATSDDCIDASSEGTPDEADAAPSTQDPVAEACAEVARLSASACVRIDVSGACEANSASALPQPAEVAGGSLPLTLRLSGPPRVRRRAQAASATAGGSDDAVSALFAVEDYLLEKLDSRLCVRALTLEDFDFARLSANSSDAETAQATSSVLVLLNHLLEGLPLTSITLHRCTMTPTQLLDTVHLPERGLESLSFIHCAMTDAHLSALSRREERSKASSSAAQPPLANALPPPGTFFGSMRRLELLGSFTRDGMLRLFKTIAQCECDEDRVATDSSSGDSDVVALSPSFALQEVVLPRSLVQQMKSHPFIVRTFAKVNISGHRPTTVTAAPTQHPQ